MRFSKRKLHLLFFLFYVGVIETEKENKRKWKRQKKPIKNSVFLSWSSKNVKKSKEWIFFGKNCLTRFVSGREKNVHFRAHYLFWPKTFLAQTV